MRRSASKVPRAPRRRSQQHLPSCVALSFPSRLIVQQHLSLPFFHHPCQPSPAHPRPRHQDLQLATLDRPSSATSRSRPMSYAVFKSKDLALPSNPLLPTRASLTPRRLIPIALASLALVGLASLRLSKDGNAISIADTTSVNTVEAVERVVEAWIPKEPVDRFHRGDWAEASKPLRVNAAVEERLRAWELAPAGEPAEWVKESIKVTLFPSFARMSRSFGPAC